VFFFMVYSLQFAREVIDEIGSHVLLNIEKSCQDTP
jgi:hypothetical protein